MSPDMRHQEIGFFKFQFGIPSWRCCENFHGFVVSKQLFQDCPWFRRKQKRLRFVHAGKFFRKNSCSMEFFRQLCQKLAKLDCSGCNPILQGFVGIMEKNFIYTNSRHFVSLGLNVCFSVWIYVVKPTNSHCYFP